MKKTFHHQRPKQKNILMNRERTCFFYFRILPLPFFREIIICTCHCVTMCLFISVYARSACVRVCVYCVCVCVCVCTVCVCVYCVCVCARACVNEKSVRRMASTTSNTSHTCKNKSKEKHSRKKRPFSPVIHHQPESSQKKK